MDFTRRGFLEVGGNSAALLLLNFGRKMKSAGLNQGQSSSPASSVPRHIIIDTDPGVDDAVSILLAFKSPEVVVDAVTVVAGNVEASVGSRNARLLVEMAGRDDVPVAVGARGPLAGPMITARLFHGKNGLGDIDVPEPKKQLEKQNAADLIVERVRANPGKLSIVAIGPLTNVALAIQKDPSIAAYIASLSIMGGTILSNGNVSPVATFNIYADPEAARIVINSGIPRISLVGTDVTTKVQFTEPDMRSLDGSKLGHFAAELGRFRLRRFQTAHTPGGTPSTVGFNDLSTMVYAIQPALFTAESMKVDIETQGELTRGMTVANRRNRTEKFATVDGHLDIVGDQEVKPNAVFVVGIHEQRVKDLFLERLRA